MLQDRAADDRKAGSPGLRAGFQEWLAADPSHRVAYEDLQRLWLDADEISALTRRRPPSQDSWLDAASVVAMVSPSRRRAGRRWRRPAVAAALVAGLGVAAALWPFWRSARNTISTGQAERFEVVLADGSRIHLNAETAVEVSIDDKRREIELGRGEAVFSVARDPDRPFVVATAEGTVEAIGTEFSVDTRAGGVEVAVLEGRVRLIPRRAPGSGGTTTPIEVGAAGVARLAGGRATVRRAAPAEIERSVSWRRGILEFDDIPLAQLIRDLDPYVPGSILVPSEDLGSMRVGGILRVGDGHDPLGSLAETLSLEVTRIGGFWIVVRGDPSPGHQADSSP